MITIVKQFKDNMDLYIISSIPVLPFCLSANVYAYLCIGNKIDLATFGHCMLVMAGVLLLVCIAIFGYSLKACIKQKSEQYNLLLVLGISSKDFWLLLVKEYCSVFIYVILIITFLSTIVSEIILFVLFHEVNSFRISGKIMAFLILLFLLGLVGSILILKWRQRKSDLAVYLENLNGASEKIHKYRFAYGTKLCIGIFSLLASIYLMVDYSVGKGFIAVFLHLISIYLFLQINSRFVKKIMSCCKEKYFKNLLICNDMIYEYRMNGNIIYSIYAVNFLLTFFIAGLLASDFPKDSFYSALRLLVCFIGGAIVLEEQAFILEKLMLDMHKENKQYDILHQLGISKKEYRQFVCLKIKNMTIFPIVFATIAGVMFFIRDYVFQEETVKVSEIWSNVLQNYILFVIVFLIIQYCGYSAIKKRVMNRYEN